MPWISSAKGVGYALQSFFSRVFPLSDGSEFGGAPLQDGRFSLTADFFERTTPPLMLVVVALTGVGPMFGWGSTNVPKFLRSCRWPALAAAVITSVAAMLGVRSVDVTCFRPADFILDRHKSCADRPHAPQRLAPYRRLRGARWRRATVAGRCRFVCLRLRRYTHGDSTG